MARLARPPRSTIRASRRLDWSDRDRLPRLRLRAAIVMVHGSDYAEPTSDNSPCHIRHLRVRACVSTPEPADQTEHLLRSQVLQATALTITQPLLLLMF